MPNGIRFLFRSPVSISSDSGSGVALEQGGGQVEQAGGRAGYGAGPWRQAGRRAPFMRNISLHTLFPQ